MHDANVYGEGPGMGPETAVSCIQALYLVQRLRVCRPRSSAVEQYEALDLQDLRLSVSHALDIIDSDASVVDAEVCASWCEQQVGPIQYDTDHPTPAGQQPRSQTTSGIGILVVMAHQDGHRLGFGSESQDLSP